MAITKDLAPGDYTANYSKNGYYNANVHFNVSSTGVVTCTDIDGNREACDHVTIDGRKLTFHMTEVPKYTTSVISVTPNKTSYNVGETISITVTVKNTGNVANILSSKLKKGSNVLDTRNTSGAIAVNATATLTHTFTATSAMVGSATYTIETYHLGHPVSGTKTVSITVVAPCPTPSISSLSASPSAPKTGESVSFSQEASGGVINVYDWDWGDGTTHGTGATPSHTYTTAGTYSVKLTVTNSCGKTATKTISIVVTQATFAVTFVSVPSGATITVT